MITAGESESESETKSESDAETGEEQAPAPGDWLIYRVGQLPDKLRAVDLGELDQGVIGPPVELAEGAYGWGDRTPWGGWSFALDDEYTLIGLDVDGQPEVYPGVPPDVPAKAEQPRFSADGSVAIFAGDRDLPLDNYYWVRFEHGHPVDGGPIAPMWSSYSTHYRVSPDGSYGVALTTGPAGEQWYQFSLDPEPGELEVLFEEGEVLQVVEVFDHHLFGTTSNGGTDAGINLVYVDMSSGAAGEQIEIPSDFSEEHWFSPSGETVVWLEYPQYSDAGLGRLRRMDVVDGVPQPPIELTEPDEVVDSVSFLDGVALLGWVPNVDFWTPMRLRWAYFAGSELGATYTIDETNEIESVSWAPAQGFVSWGDGWRGVAALDGPQAAVPYYLERDDTDYFVGWLDDRMIYSTGDGAQLWSVALGEAGPGPSLPVDPPGLEPAYSRRIRRPIVGHDAYVLEVTPEVDSPVHLQLLRWDSNGSPEALLIDETPDAYVLHQIVYK